MDNQVKTYIVIWHGNEYVTKDHEKAIDKAKEFTHGEYKYDTALILTRCEWFGDFPDVEISNVKAIRWVGDGIYELVNLLV